MLQNYTIRKIFAICFAPLEVGLRLVADFLRRAGRDAALRRPRPERSVGRNDCGKTRALAVRFRRLTLRSAKGTAQRANPTNYSTRKIFAACFAPPKVSCGWSDRKSTR